MYTQKKELTKDAKLRAILQEFKTVHWQNGLDSLDYSLPLEELKIIATSIKDMLDNFDFKAGDCVVKVGEINKRGTIIQVNAINLASGFGDVMVLWDSNNNEFESCRSRMMSNQFEEVNSSDLVYVFSPN